jgi:hypothetical protein
MKEYYICRHCYMVLSEDRHPVVCERCLASSWIIVTNDLTQMTRQYGRVIMLRIMIILTSRFKLRQ